MFQGKMLGMFGSTSTGISPTVMWPNKAEMADREDYEKVLYDGLTLREMMEAEWKRQDEEKAAIQKT